MSGEEEGEDPSPPSTPPSAVSCLAAIARPASTEAAAGTGHALGAVITSAVSGRAYRVLRTIAGANVGHGKKRTSILLAAPMLPEAAAGEGRGADGGAASVVIKVCMFVCIWYRRRGSEAQNKWLAY
jgi:hypothetical protein